MFIKKIVNLLVGNFNLEYLFYTFQKILLFLPDLLHKRWQFNSIGIVSYINSKESSFRFKSHLM